MKLEEHCIHGRDMVEDFHLSLEAIRLAKRSAWGANTEMQVLAVGIQWGMDEANKNIKKLEAENARLQEQLRLTQIDNNLLMTENAQYREALEFYADEKCYHGYDPVIISDGGDSAREALKGE